MINIDLIMDMLDCNKANEVQEYGRKLAKEVKCINVFLQPSHPEHNKNVWENCAKVLAERSDRELRPYLHELFQWLLDMNWPGARCIFGRLTRYRDKEWFDFMLAICINEAKALGEEIWLHNLYEVRDRAGIFC